MEPYGGEALAMHRAPWADPKLHAIIPIAVSYTHLDVYKRQASGKILRRLLKDRVSAR